MSLPVIVIGGGGHAQVVISSLQSRKIEIIGFTTLPDNESQATILGVECIGDDEMLKSYPPNSILLANGVGSTRDATLRKSLFNLFREKSYRFFTVLHTHASIADNAKIGEGSQIMAGAIVQTECVIGKNTIVNTGSIIDHHCVLGDHCHVAPGVAVGGAVQIGADAHIGIGASIIQGIHVGDGSLVAAGATVTKDVPANSKVAGVPALPMST